VDVEYRNALHRALLNREARIRERFGAPFREDWNAYQAALRCDPIWCDMQSEWRTLFREWVEERFPEYQPPWESPSCLGQPVG
jgi:hypothetical protein